MHQQLSGLRTCLAAAEVGGLGNADALVAELVGNLLDGQSAVVEQSRGRLAEGVGGHPVEANRAAAMVG